MKFGDQVIVSRILERKWEQRPSKTLCSRLDNWKFWKPKSIKMKSGILIGFRTLKNGVVEWAGEDEGKVFYPKEHFTAGLVVFNDKENPVYVPLEKSSISLRRV